MNALIKRLRGYHEALTEEDMSAWDLPFGGDPEDFHKAADALEAMEWRDIEDAPISTPIWAKCPWDGEVHICRIVIEECQNQDSFSREFYLARNYSNHASYDTVFERPTHFMLIKEMKSD